MFYSVFTTTWSDFFSPSKIDTIEPRFLSYWGMLSGSSQGSFVGRGRYNHSIELLSMKSGELGGVECGGPRVSSEKTTRDGFDV